MDKLCLVTSVFKVRQTRPIEYYLTPTVHLIQDLADSDINICLFTDQDKNQFPSVNNLHVFQVHPESFIKEMWDEPNWKTIYSNALTVRNRRRPEWRDEQRLVPRLLSVWLGKLPMMKQAAELGGHVLWQDSGIRMPKLFNKNFSKYTRGHINPKTYNEFTHDLMDKHPLVFMRNNRRFYRYNGVEMKKYGHLDQHQIRAGFILARSEEMPNLQEQIKQKWQFLVENKDYGTEENALTFYHWDRPDSFTLSYDHWMAGLGLN